MRRLRLGAGAGLGLSAALGITATAQADVETFTVTKTADTAGGNCTVPDPDCSLREALAAANDGDPLTDVDRILFAAAVTGTINVTGSELPAIANPPRPFDPGPPP